MQRPLQFAPCPGPWLGGGGGLTASLALLAQPAGPWTEAAWGSRRQGRLSAICLRRGLVCSLGTEGPRVLAVAMASGTCASQHRTFDVDKTPRPPACARTRKGAREEAEMAVLVTLLLSSPCLADPTAPPHGHQGPAWGRGPPAGCPALGSQLGVLFGGTVSRPHFGR